MVTTMHRGQIYLDGESGDEMSESDDGVGTFVDGPTKSLKKTKKEEAFQAKDKSNSSW